MKIGIITKNRISNIKTLLTGIFESYKETVICENLNLVNIKNNINYLKKLDGLFLDEEYQEEIVDYLDIAIDDAVDFVRIKNNQLIGYNIKDYAIFKSTNVETKIYDKAIEHHKTIKAYRILKGYLDFTSPVINKIYESMLKYDISDKRFTHMLATNKQAKLINKFNNLQLNEIDIETAAILHDITKEAAFDDKVIDELNISKLPKSVWHSYTGARLVKKEFNIKNEDIINAIKYHSTGRANMSVLEEVICLADFCDETRTYKPCVEARVASLKNYKLGLALKFDRLKDLRKDTFIKDSIDAYNKYKENL